MEDEGPPKDDHQKVIMENNYNGMCLLTFMYHTDVLYFNPVYQHRLKYVLGVMDEE